MPLNDHAREELSSHITSGLRISIDIQLKDDVKGMKKHLTLSSIVEEVLDNNSLLIHMPIHQGYHYPMPRDESVVMKFFVEPTVYGLPLQFVQRVERDDLVFAEMLIVGKLEEYQQRDCYRLPCNISVEVERPYMPEEQKKLKSKSSDEDDYRPKNRMINFSDGGMLLATDEEIERGEKITLTFDIGQAETVQGLALRTDRIEEGTHLFRVAIQFLGIDKTRRHRFYKYIVEKQLEERRRHL